MSKRALAGGTALLVALALVPFFAADYVLHIAIQILLWGFIYTAWSVMGRFGLTSFGHGAFLGIGAYVPALLWNYYGVTPWFGIPIAMAVTVLVAVLIGYPSFRLRVVGHYFALVTMALSQVVAAVAGRGARGDWWLARHDPQRRAFLAGIAVCPEKLVLRGRVDGVAGWAGGGLVAGRCRDRAGRAGSNLRGRDRRRVGRHQCDARKIAGDDDQCCLDCARRRVADRNTSSTSIRRSSQASRYRCRSSLPRSPAGWGP